MALAVDPLLRAETASSSAVKLMMDVIPIWLMKKLSATSPMEMIMRVLKVVSVCVRFLRKSKAILVY